jgi:serine phosphatase RsbU (regulator of sigma subunit)
VLKPNSTVYLFSDGFADQFGGTNGKKYKHAHFRAFLVSIAHLPMDVQYKRVREEFLDWMGDLDQVDDVVVMGVRL